MCENAVNSMSRGDNQCVRRFLLPAVTMTLTVQALWLLVPQTHQYAALCHTQALACLQLTRCLQLLGAAAVSLFQGFPTIKFFYVSNGKIKSSAYNGGRSAKELVTFALDKVGRLAAAEAAARNRSSSRSSRTM